MPTPFEHFSARRAHLEADNPLRSLTEVINKVPGGINLGQGVCDLDTPEPLQRGAVESIAGGVDRQLYTHYSGLPELRAQIARKLERHNGLRFDDDQIMVAAGSSAAFFAAAMTLLEPGDEVVLFEPFYSYHYSTLKLVGAVPVCVPLTGEDLAFDADRLRAALTPRTRAVMVNTPANPSGKVFSRGELADLAEVLASTDVIVFTDEVYEYMCFDGREHVSPATLPELAERCLTMSSFSKTYSVTGWRIGFLAGPRDVVEATGRVVDQMMVCASRPMQRGVERALRELPDSFYSDLQASYQRRRDQFCAALRDAGFGFSVPQGAYYVLADYSDVLGDLEPYDAARSLIDRIGVNGVPGHVFCARPEGVRTLRFQFAVTETVLDDVCARFARLG